MANISKYSTLALHDNHSIWEQLPLKKRKIANARFVAISEILELIKDNHTVSSALRVANIPTVDHPSIRRWIKAYMQDGRMGLVTKHKGRKIKKQLWHNIAAELYLQDSAPSRESVAKKLLYGSDYMLSEKGVSKYQICHFLKKNFAENSEERIGKHNHTLNHKVYKRVDFSNIKPGDIYQGDGHTIDLYLAHHNTGKPTRYEFTVWIDVASRYIVGYALSNAESSYTTLQSLSNALITHNHSPLYLHIDNGSGFINKMLNAEGVGFYERLGLGIKKSIPGNPKGKGRVERWFKTFEMQLSQIIGTGFCGRGIDPIVKGNWHNKARKKQALIYSVEDFTNFLNKYLEQYHRTPHRGDGMNKRTPAQVWGLKKLRALDVPHDYFIWAQDTRKVQKGTIRIQNREYVSNLLVAFNSQQVVVEYAINNDSFIKVFSSTGNFITQAELVKRTKHYLSASVLKDQEAKQKQQKLKRVNAKAQEIEQEYTTIIDGQIQNLEQIGGLQIETKKQPDLLDIDILGTST